MSYNVELVYAPERPSRVVKNKDRNRRRTEGMKSDRETAREKLDDVVNFYLGYWK